MFSFQKLLVFGLIILSIISVFKVIDRIRQQSSSRNDDDRRVDDETVSLHHCEACQEWVAQACDRQDCSMNDR